MKVQSKVIKKIGLVFTRREVATLREEITKLKS